jgi:hypothetical protein
MKLNKILLECLGIPFENKCNIIIINSNGEEINVDCEIPTTPEEKSQGLMYRDELGENNGMFYDYIDNGFWMDNVEIPLEMIFINDNEISEIKKARPFDRTNISPVLPADSNLEVNQGFCNNNNIQVGDKIYKS